MHIGGHPWSKLVFRFVPAPRIFGSILGRHAAEAFCDACAALAFEQAGGVECPVCGESGSGSLKIYFRGAPTVLAPTPHPPLALVESRSHAQGGQLCIMDVAQAEISVLDEIVLTESWARDRPAGELDVEEVASQVTS